MHGSDGRYCRYPWQEKCAWMYAVMPFGTLAKNERLTWGKYTAKSAVASNELSIRCQTKKDQPNKEQTPGVHPFEKSH